MRRVILIVMLLASSVIWGCEAKERKAQAPMNSDEYGRATAQVGNNVPYNFTFVEDGHE